MPERICEVCYHFDNLEDYPILNNEEFKEDASNVYMDYRNIFADIFNAKIDGINKAWDKLGLPSSFGDYAEDINPEYVKFIREKLDDEFKEANDRIYEEDGCPMEFYLDDYSDIRGRIRGIDKLSIWISIRPVQKD